MLLQRTFRQRHHTPHSVSHPHHAESINPSESNEEKEPKGTAVTAAAPSNFQEEPGKPMGGERKWAPPKKQGRKYSVDLGKAKLIEAPVLSGTSWKRWAGVRAVSKNEKVPTSSTVGELQKYSLVADNKPFSANQFSSLSPWVVADTRLGLVGVVTGVMIVVLKEGVSADFLKNNSDLKILNESPGIRTCFVTAAQDPFDLVALKDYLTRDPGVQEVQLEVLSRQYEKY